MLQGGKNNMKNKINLCPNCHSLAHKGKYSAKELLSKKIIVEKIIQKDNDLGKPSLSKKINPITTKESITKDTLTKDNGLSKDNLFLDLIPDGLQTEKFIRDWKKWIAWRKEDRHTLKRTTAKRQLKMLNSQPDPIAVLKKSLDNGYQGLFPLKAPQQFHPKSNVAKGKYDNV